MHTSGGRVSVTINGVPYHARGEITIDVANMEIEVGANQDGSNYRTVKPKPRRAELTFDKFLDDAGTPLRWNESVLRMTNFGVSFTELDTGRTHLLSNACFEGSPQVNLATGEVSNLKIAADSYEGID
jgi:hypothetical protein